MHLLRGQAMFDTPRAVPSPPTPLPLSGRGEQCSVNRMTELHGYLRPSSRAAMISSVVMGGPMTASLRCF